VERISLMFAGDIMQHETQLKAARTEEGTYSFKENYRYIRSTIEASDIAIGNLETPIGKHGFSGYPSFCAPDSFLYAAAYAGFDVLLLANNHCLDKGKATAMHTLEMMDSLGVEYCGVYRNELERRERYPLIIDKKGVRIALLNYTYSTNGREVPEPMVVNFIDKETISKDIIDAKCQNPDVIIACMHWGDEYVSLPPARIKEMADWLIAQGVDHIIGSHPHVIQPMELRFNEEECETNAVVYSMGNLLSNMSLRRTDGGIMVGMELTRILNYTRVSSLGYMYTWIAPKDASGKRDFTIYPASTTRINGNSHAREKLQLFLDDSRTLFRKHNKGDIQEILTDSVTVTL
jgi:poly-gamma-glutamate synthesis protein (capsule biosynthesis protein)